MRRLKLGAEGLSTAEVGLVKTLLKLMATEPEFPWVFALEGPFDALLADTSVVQLRTDASHTIRLVHRGQSVPLGAFERPINAPALEGWLRTAEQQLKPTAFMGLDHETHAAALQHEPEPLPRTPIAAAKAPFEDNRDTYKLTRWPPSMVLRNDRNRIRLATLITRQAMDLTQLAHISGLPIHECASFVVVLNALHLVTVTAAPIATAVPTPNMPSNSSLAANTRGKSLGFISAIRRKLGL